MLILFRTQPVFKTFGDDYSIGITNIWIPAKLIMCFLAAKSKENYLNTYRQIVNVLGPCYNMNVFTLPYV